MRRPGLLVQGWFFLLLLLAVRASALDIRETVWGFDGRVVPGRMNVVSLRVANPANTPFEGALTLRELGGIGARSGAPWVQPIYFSAHAERWVQIAVFVALGYEQWQLEWAPGKSVALRQPSTGPPARVILTEEGGSFIAGSALRSFSDALFPTTVAATDALDGMAIDYPPRWEAARREALVDWVRRGGVLLVLHGADGAYPKFSEQLAVLNGDAGSARLGAGTIVRLPITRREVTEKSFVECGFPTPEMPQTKSVIIYNLEQTIFQRLAGMTRPEIRWWLINGLSLVYLLLIGPIHFSWGRKRTPRVSIAALVICVALFSTGFAIVGRRGYGEAQTAHSLSIARQLEPGRFDVTQWISAFVTSGDTYQLTHRAASNLYGAPSSEEINGAITNGREGQFLVDIPLFSSRQFVHRAAMTGDDTSVTVERWEEAGDELKTIVLKTSATFPKGALEIRARFRDRFYLLARNGPDLVLAKAEQAVPFASFLPAAKVQAGTYLTPDSPMATPLQDMLPLLYVRALDGREHLQTAITRGPQPAGQLELFIFAPSPESFSLQGKGFTAEVGFTLYVQTVFKP